MAFPQSEVLVRVNAKNTVQDFRLSPGAELSGKVIDEESGKPVAGMLVQLYRTDYSNGIARLMSAGSRASGSDGSFQFKELAPDSYVLEVAPTRIRVSRDGSRKPTQGVAYRRQYYPQSSTSEGAAPLQLTAGDRRSVEFVLTRKKPLSVSGVIEIGSDRKGETLSILLSDELHWSTIGIVMGQLSDGPFRIDNLGPGTYRLSGRSNAKPRLYGDSQITLTDHDIEGIRLVVQQGYRLGGIVHMKGDGDGFPGGVNVTLEAVGRQQVASVDFSDGGQFTADELPLGQYFVRVSKPADYVVTNFTYGGHSVLWSALKMEGLPGARLEITLEKGAAIGSVGGIVRRRDGEPAAGLVMILIPERMPSPFDAVAAAQVASDSAGRFNFGAVAPGSYRLIQFTGEEARTSRDSALIARKAPSGELVAVTAGSLSSLELTVK